MSKVHAVSPELNVGSLLLGAQFIDAYRTTVDMASLDATAAARQMLGRQPRWVKGMMRLRNALVKPFGLKTGHPSEDPRGRVGIFPINSATPNRIVLGFPDKHLDFLLVVDVSASDSSSEITATTMVRTNNLLGRIYLAAILPFHRLVVRSALNQIASTSKSHVNY
jgi:hypothetical protein